MTHSSNKLLHIMLILMMVLLPMRGAFAMQLVACDMHGQPSARSMDHCQHQAATTAADDAQRKQSSGTFGDCCGDSGACASICHFAMSASLMLPGSDYSPVILATAVFETPANALLVRELSPPSRPPLNLHS